jgi:hypothetical protein
MWDGICEKVVGGIIHVSISVQNKKQRPRMSPETTCVADVLPY